MRDKIANLKQQGWTDVVGFEGLYLVSPDSKVLSLRTNTIMKPQKIANGYYNLVFTVNGKKTNYSLHKILAKAFLPNIENKKCVNHIDGDKLNNKLSNLEWSTYSENNKHAFDNNLNISLKTNGFKKLDIDKVKFIKENKDKFKISELANKFNVTYETIWHILKGNTWKEVY